MELYHYLHCPYCIRVRLAWGYLGVKYKSIVVPYSDEKTPTELCGKKMLPIAKLEDGKVINESLDIIASVDKDNQLDWKGFLTNNLDRQTHTQTFLDELSGPVFNLCMPFFVLTPEFSQQDRTYFIEKKSAKRGPFTELIQRKDDFAGEVNLLLEKYASKLNPYFGHNSPSLRLEDILVASHLWGLYNVPEFRFSNPWHDYLQRVKAECKFKPWEEWKGYLES